MREIKFRAWHKQQRVMTYKPPFQLFDGEMAVANHWVAMQYTDLHDRNGREVYEGDIVKVNGGELDLEFISRVIFARGAFRIEAVYDQGWPAQVDIEVIGNIYEHPELVKS